MSDSVWPHRQQPTRLPRPWESPGKNTGVGCHFLLQCMKVKSESEFAQSCPTLSDRMDCSPPGSSVHGILQAGALEWGAIAFSESSLRSLHTVLHSGCTNLHSQKQYRRVPFSPHPHPLLWSPVFWVKAMLTGMNQYLTEVNICLGDICWGIRHHLPLKIMGRIFRKGEFLGCPEGELSVLWEEDQSTQMAVTSNSS